MTAMTLLTILLWLSLGILFYCYIGYGMLAFMVTKAGKLLRPRLNENKEPVWLPVTLVVTVYNEEAVLLQKIRNIRELDYPPELLRVLFVTDGSADNSAALVGQYPFINLLHQPERKGKYAAIKRAMQAVQTPIVVFSDANAMLNPDSIRKLVAHYRDPKVGGVAGEKKIVGGKDASAVGQAEGWYWKYESLMKKLDAGLYTVVGAAGELFSIRTNLFTGLNDDLILDDFIISMQVCQQGYKIEYEPGAWATESPSVSLAEEEKRKIRIAAGSFQSLAFVKNSFNLFRHPLLSFQFISRRLLRWVFCPLLLIGLPVLTVMIVSSPGHPVLFNWIGIAQLVFYGAAFGGYLLVRAGKKAGIFNIPFYFVFMNYCLIKGFARYIRGRQTVLWEKTLRQAVE